MTKDANYIYVAISYFFSIYVQLAIFENKPNEICRHLE